MYHLKVIFKTKIATWKLLVLQLHNKTQNTLFAKADV